VESELLNPLVPVALVELGAVPGMSEQSRPLTDLRPEGLIEGPEAAGAELLPGPGVPVVLCRSQFAQHGRPGLAGPGDGGDSLAQLLPSPAVLGATAGATAGASAGATGGRRSAGTTAGPPSATQRSSCSKSIGGGSASIISISRSCASIRPSSIGVS